MPEGPDISPSEPLPEPAIAPVDGPLGEPVTEAVTEAVTEGSGDPAIAPVDGPPMETSTRERELRFEPVHKVRSRPVTPVGGAAASSPESGLAGQADGAVDAGGDAGGEAEGDAGGERPFAHVAEAGAQSSELSPWEKLRSHPSFRQMLAIAVIGAVVLAGALAWSVRSGTGAPQKKAEQFLDYMVVEDYARARALFDPVCSNNVSERTLEGVFNGYQFKHFLDKTEIAGSGAVVTGIIEVAGVGEVPARINLRRVGGDWLICGIGTR